MRRVIFAILAALVALSLVSGVPTQAGGEQPGCPPATRQDFPIATDVTFTGPAIVHPWWNNGKPTFGQQQVRVMVPLGTVATIYQMMGKSWTYVQNQACANNLQREFENAAQLPVLSLDKLVEQKLGSVTTQPVPTPTATAPPTVTPTPTHTPVPRPGATRCLTSDEELDREIGKGDWSLVQQAPPPYWEYSTHVNPAPVTYITGPQVGALYNKGYQYGLGLVKLGVRVPAGTTVLAEGIVDYFCPEFSGSTLFVPAINVAPKPIPTIVIPSVPPVPGCPSAREETVETTRDVLVRGSAIVWPWFRESSFGQEQLRLLIWGGEVKFLGMSGKIWRYEDNQACRNNLAYEVNQNQTLKLVSIQFLQQEGKVFILGQ